MAIVGAGQVGTALGLALRSKASSKAFSKAPAPVAEVALFDREPAVARASLRRGAGDRVLRRLDEALEADTLVLAVPVPAVVELVAHLGPRLRPGSFLLDTGSTKGPVVRAMRRWVPADVHALGGHPMAGTEVAGPAGARADLLAGAPFALVPVREDPEALRRGRALARAVGARPVVVDARTHDRTVARTSHLPHLLAAALATVAEAASRGPGGSLRSSGLDGAVRLAASDPAMVAGFLAANGPEVRRALAELRRALDRAAAALDRAAVALDRAGAPDPSGPSDGPAPGLRELERFLARAQGAASVLRPASEPREVWELRQTSEPRNGRAGGRGQAPVRSR
ncbi:MAG TPA: prephenate dehydrogenase [Actinomycetota bacterium]|nr:prephenate dehydrogenase [Actinomycetota bacterium]